MIYRKFVTSAALAVMFLGLGSPPAHATQTFFVPSDQMARESAVVVRARVGHQQTQWNSQRTRIVTTTEIHVLDGLKGAASGDILRIYQVAGTLDGVTFAIPGALRFAKDEEIIFFAQPFRDMVVSYGMGLGKYVVRRDAAGPTVEPQFGDVSWVEKDAGSWKPTSEPAVKPVPLHDFVNRMRRVITAGAGGQP